MKSRKRYVLFQCGLRAAVVEKTQKDSFVDSRAANYIQYHIQVRCRAAINYGRVTQVPKEFIRFTGVCLVSQVQRF